MLFVLLVTGLFLTIYYNKPKVSAWAFNNKSKDKNKKRENDNFYSISHTHTHRVGMNSCEQHCSAIRSNKINDVPNNPTNVWQEDGKQNTDDEKDHVQRHHMLEAEHRKQENAHTFFHG